MATNQADIREIVLEVIAETHGSQKEFAINADAPQSDVSNAFSGKQRLEMQWVLDQPDVFLDRVLNKIRARKGMVTDSDARLAKIARITELVRLILEVA